MTFTGRLLVATPVIADPNFERTVVLILAHGDEGALGVVLNRPSLTAVAEVVEEWAPYAAEPDMMFIGGPVGQNAVVGLGLGSASHDGIQPVVGPLGTIDLNEPPDPDDGAAVRSACSPGPPGGPRASSRTSWPRVPGGSSTPRPTTRSPANPTSCGPRSSAARARRSPGSPTTRTTRRRTSREGKWNFPSRGPPHRRPFGPARRVAASPRGDTGAAPHRRRCDRPRSARRACRHGGAGSAVTAADTPTAVAVRGRLASSGRFLGGLT